MQGKRAVLVLHEGRIYFGIDEVGGMVKDNEHTLCAISLGHKASICH